MGHLTVAQNIFIGREWKKGLLIDDARMNEEARKLFAAAENRHRSARKPCRRLTVGKQQMCEIAKAISHEAKIIVFDEPTAALTDTEIEQLFRIIRDLRAEAVRHRIHLPPHGRNQADHRPRHRDARRPDRGHADLQRVHQGRHRPHDGRPRDLRRTQNQQPRCRRTRPWC